MGPLLKSPNRISGRTGWGRRFKGGRSDGASGFSTSKGLTKLVDALTGRLAIGCEPVRNPRMGRFKQEDVAEALEYFIIVMKRLPESGKELVEFSTREADAGHLPSKFSTASHIAKAAADYSPKLLAFFERIHGRQPRTKQEYEDWILRELKAGRLPLPKDIDKVDKH